MESSESDGSVRCDTCENSATVEIWHVESLLTRRKNSFCDSCSRAWRPPLGSDTRPRRTSQSGDIEIDLAQVIIMEGCVQAVLRFIEIGGNRHLNVAIAEDQARQLVDALLAKKRANPMVHQAWVDAFVAINAKLLGVHLSDVREQVLQGQLHFASGNLEARVDIMPTDGLCIAAWAKSRIYATESVLAWEESASPRKTPDTVGSMQTVSRSGYPKHRRDVDFVGTDRQAVALLMKWHSGDKPPALSAAQSQSLGVFYERMKELSLQPERLTLDLATQIVYLNEDAGPRVLFSQLVADDVVRRRFASIRSLLPPSMGVHELPLERVGALATLELSALAACANSADEDFIALSMGVYRLSHWGLLAARALELVELEENPEFEVESYPLSWWRGSLAAVAMDLIGWPFDVERSNLISAWAEQNAKNADIHGHLRIMLEGFVFLHEIAHFEMHYGIVQRQLILKGKLQPENYYVMEYEADRFALEHILTYADRGTAIGQMLAILFALFGSEPTMLERYPLCDEAETHPHPLTRLVWLLRQLYPGDFCQQRRCLDLAASIVTCVIKELDGVALTRRGLGEEDLALLIRGNAIGKPDLSELHFGPQHNEVLDTVFRVRDAMRKASRKRKGG